MWRVPGARLTAIDLGPNNQLGIKCRPTMYNFYLSLYHNINVSDCQRSNGNRKRISEKTEVFREVKPCELNSYILLNLL